MARQNFKAGTLEAPLPAVLVSVGDMEESNLITIAWTGILSSDPPRTYISVRPSRHSHKIIMEKREFVINLTTENLARATDFAGIYTGAKVDKFKKCNLTKVAVEEVAVPLIDESPLSLCCRVTDIVSLGSHDMFMADIVAVYADDTLLDDKGKLHIAKAGLCAYAHGEYFALGKRVGTFGFSAKKKKPKGTQSKQR